MCIYGETPSIFWLTWHVAIKEHECCECLSTISTGERYELSKGVWDGVFSAYKTCSICSQVRNRALSDYEFDDGIAFGCLWETIGVEGEI